MPPLKTNTGAKYFRVLVVEDNEKKFHDIEGALKLLLRTRGAISRAKTVVEAEDLLERGWDLLVLDISMDISPGSVGPMKGGHANLGGFDVIDRMFFLEITIPTLILTGFDSFQAFGLRSDETEMLGLQDIEKKTEKLLGDAFISCIRYGSAGWAEKFRNSIRSHFNK